MSEEELVHFLTGVRDEVRIIIQACHSFWPSRDFMSVTIDGPETGI